MNAQYRTINKCIYCGNTTDLGDEHILPLSLWGTDLLKKASCRNCEKITTKFERHVAHELLLPVRAYMGYKSRRKSKLPQSFTLDVIDKQGKPQTLTLDAKEQPAFMVFPEYEAPRLLKDGKVQHGSALNGSRLIAFGTDVEALAKKYNFKTINGRMTLKGNEFPRFLAKWAYCIAVNQYGLLTQTQNCT